MGIFLQGNLNWFLQVNSDSSRLSWKICMRTHAAAVAALPPPLPLRCCHHRCRRATVLPASATLLPLLACCHHQRHTALNDAIAFIFIVVVVAVIIAVSVTVANAAFS